MPEYTYQCQNCEYEFDIVQPIKNKPKKKCPECKKMALERLIGRTLGFVRRDAKTVGQLAERNTSKMGHYELDEMRGLQKQRKKNADKAKKEELEQKFKGMKVPDKLDNHNPWYGKADKSLGNMTPEQKKKYILTGKKNG